MVWFYVAGAMFISSWCSVTPALSSDAVCAALDDISRNVEQHMHEFFVEQDECHQCLLHSGIEAYISYVLVM